MMTDPMIFLQIPAKIQFLPAIGKFANGLFAALEEFFQDEHVSYDLELIVSEACTNVIRHAYPDRDNPGILQLKLWYDPHKICIEIVDFGPGFDLETIEDPDLKEPKEGGMGLFIIRQLTDRVEYIRDSQGNRLYLEKDL
jgi:serine/threonine-protein kinase RsbW